MEARRKLKPVEEMTTKELLEELLYSNDSEQYEKNKKNMAKYLDSYAGLYGK